MHATPADVSTVIVNGEVVKRDGILRRVDWSKVKCELARNRLDLKEKYRGVDWEVNINEVGRTYHLLD